MARRRRERHEISADDVEAVDLEPVDLDLEPVDLELVDPADVRVERRPDGRRDERRRIVALLTAVVAIVVAFAFVAVKRSGQTARRAAPPAVPTTGISPAFGAADPVSALMRRLKPYWPDGEAIVMFGRIYVARARDPKPELVVPERKAVIDDQSGSSLLLSTFPELLVATEPRVASRLLSRTSIAVRATEPDEWWILTSDGALRDSSSSKNVLHPPSGLRVAAAVPDGFVALDVRHSQWVVWSGEPSTRPIIDSHAQLVAARGPTILFRSGCTIDGCSVEVFDLARRSVVHAYVPGVPDFAVFSPTGSRLALASSLGDVFLMDPATGDMIAHTRSRTLPSLSSPVAWSSDGQRLIVVQDDSVEVRDAMNGTVSDVITGTTGLEQLVGLP